VEYGYHATDRSSVEESPNEIHQSPEIKPVNPDTMAFPDLAVNAIYTILCLVPGFVTVKTVTYATDLEPEMSEFEKSTWSFVASGVALSVSYFLYAAAMGIVTGRFVLIRSLDITWVELVAIYPLLLFVAVMLGYLCAKLFGWTLETSTTTPAESVR